MSLGHEVQKAILALFLLALWTLWPLLHLPSASLKSNAKVRRIHCPELPHHSAQKEWGHISLLLYTNASVDVDSKDEEGHSALYYVAKVGEVHMAKLLLHYGADINSMSSNGDTPLMAAMDAGQTEMVDWLLQHGAAHTTADGATLGARKLLQSMPEGTDPGACSAGAPPPMHHVEEYAVGSFNIRYADQGGVTAWRNRCHRVADIIAFSRLDLVGMQEVLAEQMRDFKVLLPEFQFVGVGRDDGKEAGEFATVGFRRSVFNLVEVGNFWLSETPEQPSMGWDANNMRIATFAVLTTKPPCRAARLFLFFNTHLDAYGPLARNKGAELLVHQVRRVALKYSHSHSHMGRPIIFLTGDMNSERASEPYNIILGAEIFAGSRGKASVPSGVGGALQRSTTRFVDTQDQSICLSTNAGHQQTFTGFSNEFSKVIDFVFAVLPPNAHVTRCGAYDWDWSEGQHASDHRVTVSHIAIQTRSVSSEQAASQP